MAVQGVTPVKMYSGCEGPVRFHAMLAYSWKSLKELNFFIIVYGRFSLVLQFLSEVSLLIITQDKKHTTNMFILCGKSISL